MKYCLWGHCRGWVQVGSAEDQQIQRRLRVAAVHQRLMNQIGQAMVPAMTQSAAACRRMEVAMAGFQRALDRSRTW